MFRNADAFSQDISGWDVSNVTSFRGLFRESNFNLDISSWDVSRGTTFKNMFRGNRYFNHDLSSWNLNLDANVRDMFRFATAMKKNQNVSNTPNKSDYFGSYTTPSDSIEESNQTSTTYLPIFDSSTGSKIILDEEY